MEERKNILVLDFGTTGIKVMVFDRALQLRAKTYAKMRHRGRGGRIEQDPREMVSKARRLMRAAVRKSGCEPRTFLGVGITNQRETTILWDRKTGRPIYPAIVWEDSRTAATCRGLNRKFGRLVRERTGLPIEPYFSATKIGWILKNFRRAAAAEARGDLLFGTVDSWVIWNLLEGRPHVTDFTNASRTLLWNARTGAWDPELAEIFGVPMRLLPRVQASASRFGYLRKNILGRALPVLAVAGDQQASAFWAAKTYGAGALRGFTKVTYGTGAFVTQILGPKFTLSDGFYTTVVPGPELQPLFALETKVAPCGELVEKSLDDRAALEAALTAIAKKIDVKLKKLPFDPEYIVADGGVTRDHLIQNIQSHVSGIPVLSQNNFDGTALGTALLVKASAKI